MRSVPILMLALALVTSCSDYPDLNAAISPEARRAPYPDLVPIEDVLDRRKLARTTGDEAGVLEDRAAILRRRAGLPYTATEARTLSDRATNLRRRAAMLRGITVDEDTRIRLTPGLDRLGG